MKLFFKNHYLVIITAVFVGLISILPHIIFKISLGSDYRGIYMIQTANETEYLARIQEILDGHLLLGSVPFFEYKNNPPMMPPNIFDFLIAGLSWISGISVKNLVIASKFFMPALFFLLIYFLVFSLTEKKELISGKINAIVAGLIIILGYDLIDYKNVFSFLKGENSPDYFLLWTRPVNPILGGILIYLFLLCVWSLYNVGISKTESLNFKLNSFLKLIICAGILLFLGITSYFFTWGIMLSFITGLAITFLLERNFYSLKKTFTIFIIGFILALPYFYGIFRATRSPFYKESVLRTGLFFLHTPILNKFLVFSLFLFLFITLFHRSAIHEKWWKFSLIFILSGFIALNQQIITGKTVWPFHFVQYTIPLGITAVFIAFYNIFYDKFTFLWKAVIIFFAFISIFLGVYNQTAIYLRHFDNYKEKQKYTEIFNWLNKNVEKDCVVLTKDGVFLNLATPAFTRCNVYDSDSNSFLLPSERLYHNYLVKLRLMGITNNKQAENYFENNKQDILLYFYSAEAMQNFLSNGISADKQEQTLNKLKKDLEYFSKSDFLEQLKKYKVDYLILTKKSVSKEEINLLKKLNVVYDSNNFIIAKF